MGPETQYCPVLLSSTAMVSLLRQLLHGWGKCSMNKKAHTEANDKKQKSGTLTARSNRLSSSMTYGGRVDDIISSATSDAKPPLITSGLPVVLFTLLRRAKFNGLECMYLTAQAMCTQAP